MINKDLDYTNYVNSYLRFAVTYYREKKHWNKSQLAKLSGLSQGYISRLEGGDLKNAGMDTVEKLAKAFNITPVELLTWKPEFSEEKTTYVADGIEERTRLMDAIMNELREMPVTVLQLIFDLILAVKKNLGKYHANKPA